VLPLPRRRLDPEVVRERLRALASGRSGPAPTGPAAHGPADPGPDAGDGAGTGAQPIEAHRSLRPVVVAVAATALAAWGVVHVTGGGAPSPVELLPGTPVPSASGVLAPPGGSAAATPTPDASAAVLVVQVIGQVRRPGLVRLAPGSRVADAVRAAGGLVPGGSSGGLNLARLVSDGEQVVVTPDAATAPAAGAAGATTSAVVDLNTATATDLDALPGVGPVTAGRILDWRAAHGRFTSVDQLREVSGIGARTFDRLKPHVRV
jgi:competence protein ComEA